MGWWIALPVAAAFLIVALGGGDYMDQQAVKLGAIERAKAEARTEKMKSECRVGGRGVIEVYDERDRLKYWKCQ